MKSLIPSFFLLLMESRQLLIIILRALALWLTGHLGFRIDSMVFIGCSQLIFMSNFIASFFTDKLIDEIIYSGSRDYHVCHN